MKKLITFSLIIILGISVYPQEKTQPAKSDNSGEQVIVPNADDKAEKNQSKTYSKSNAKKAFLDWINTKAYAANTDDEKKKLRNEWKRLVGADIFYPHFKMKEVEDWVKEKGSIKFFNLKGKPQFSKDEIKYIFKVKF